MLQLVPLHPFPAPFGLVVRRPNSSQQVSLNTLEAVCVA